MINKIILFYIITVCLSAVGIYGEVFDRPVGSNCSWNGLIGECTNIYNCPSALDAIRRKIHPPICSFQGSVPNVCCTSINKCLPNQSTADQCQEVGVRSTLNQTRTKARDNCLNYLNNYVYFPCSTLREWKLLENNNDDEIQPSSVNSANSRSLESSTRREKRHAEDQSRHFPTFSSQPVVGHGAPAFRMQYPHMALLGYEDEEKKTQWLCGGSVISETYILTAAHCSSSVAYGPVKFVALGILKRSDSPEYWQILNVKRIINHPEYQPPSKYNDIALLETEKTINFATHTLPACLPLVPELHDIAAATGWGALGHRQGLADILQTVELQRYDDETCSQLFPPHRLLRRGYDPSSQMCYGDRAEPKDTCEGDSGGPLQVVNEFLPCAYTLIGVTSYGREFGVSASSGMYTRVYHYVPWIESIVWP